MNAENYIRIGSLVSDKIKQYNERNASKFHCFEIGDGFAFDRLLHLYEKTNGIFTITSASDYSKTLYSLLKAAILLKPEYSTDVTSEEDKTIDRDEWEGPVTVRLNVSAISDLFFHIELITNFLNEMEQGADMIKHLVQRYEMERLQKQIEQQA